MTYLNKLRLLYLCFLKLKGKVLLTENKITLLE